MTGGRLNIAIAAGMLSGLTACRACIQPPTVSISAPAPSPAPPTAPAAPKRITHAPLSALFGINEAVSVPAPLVRNQRLRFDQQQAELYADAALTRSLGASAVRANCHTYPFLNYRAVNQRPVEAQKMADAYVQTLQEAGLQAVMVLGPWPCIQTANYTTHYLPDDMDGYASFVQDIVERYDADGVDDMPGLQRPVVLAWEIDNEPDLHNAVPPRGAKRDIDPSTFQTPQEYAEIVRVTAAAIRQAAPEATVLLGGMYNARSPSGRRYLDTVLAEPGVMDAFDVLSLHCYSEDDSLNAIEQTIAVADAVAPDRPLWITEIGVTSQGSQRWQTEDWQARMLAGIYGAAAAGGVERVFWHTLSDPPVARGQRTMPFGHHSLHRTLTPTWDDPVGAGERQQKPAGQVYARLQERLKGIDRSTVTSVSSDSGKFLQVGESRLVYWGAVTLPPQDWTVEDLLSATTQAVPGGTLVAAPAWATPVQ